MSKHLAIPLVFATFLMCGPVLAQSQDVPVVPREPQSPAITASRFVLTDADGVPRWSLELVRGKPRFKRVR